MIKLSSKDIRYFEKWAKGLSKLDFLDPLLVRKAQNLVRSMKADQRGELMSDEKADNINKMVERMQDRSPAPRLTPEQLNAIDLLILGKTDREVSELVGVRRETITKWHKNPFFIAELNSRREALWIDSKLRLKSLVSEAVNVLTDGLHSSDEKIAIASAIHILKTVGLYGEAKESVGPISPEEAIWEKTVRERHEFYLSIRPDAFSEWSLKNRFKEIAEEDTPNTIRFWYEEAVDEQKKELREFKKKEKTQLSRIEMPIIIEDIEEELPQSQGQGDKLEPIKA